MKQLDLRIAIAGFWAFLLLAGIAYRQALPFEHPPIALLDPIPLARSQGHLLKKESCIGSIRTAVEGREKRMLHGEGTADLVIGGQAVKAKLLLEAAFNPLGQLNESSLRIVFKGGWLQLKTMQVNPMALTITTFLAGEHAARALEMPGLVLLKSDSRAAELHYDPLRFLNQTAALPLAKVASMLQQERISLIYADAYGCDRGQDALDLDPLLDSMKRNAGPGH